MDAREQISGEPAASRDLSARGSHGACHNASQNETDVRRRQVNVDLPFAL